MNATLSPSTSSNETGDRVQRTAVLVALAALAVGSHVAAQEQTSAQAREQAAPQEETPAVLKLKEFSFPYRSSAVNLSCNELEGRVATILMALGARQDVDVRVTGCEGGLASPEEPTDSVWPNRNPSDRWGASDPRWGSPSSVLRRQAPKRTQSAHVHVRAMMPVVVTDEILEEMKKDKSRRELVSRVTGNAAAGLNDAIVFPAARQIVTLSHKTMKLEPEDCPLLEQMSQNAFRKLDIKVVRRSSGCDRGEISRLPPQLVVEALMPVMPATPQLAPAAGQPDPSAPAASETTSSEPTTGTPPK